MIAQAHQSARLTDRHWRNASPFLLAAIIDDADAQGFAEVDFLRGEEPYKGRIAPNHREMVRLVAGKGATFQVRRTAVRCVRFGRSTVARWKALQASSLHPVARSISRALAVPLFRAIQRRPGLAGGAATRGRGVFGPEHSNTLRKT
jgi:CelD/BcsL family acetyltransferase involved in cellulose biosynthesis